MYTGLPTRIINSIYHQCHTFFRSIFLVSLRAMIMAFYYKERKCSAVRMVVISRSLQIYRPKNQAHGKIFRSFKYYATCHTGALPHPNYANFDPSVLVKSEDRHHRADILAKQYLFNFNYLCRFLQVSFIYVYNKEQ